jgi:hypothetical protein
LLGNLEWGIAGLIHTRTHVTHAPKYKHTSHVHLDIIVYRHIWMCISLLACVLFVKLVLTLDFALMSAPPLISASANA